MVCGKALGPGMVPGRSRVLALPWSQGHSNSNNRAANCGGVEWLRALEGGRRPRGESEETGTPPSMPGNTASLYTPFNCTCLAEWLIS